MLQIYNTLSRSKEVFKPITPRHVSIYVCGMTVYDYCHLGHARVMIVFDMVVRWLMTLGYEVNYVRNITDIDDKIIQRALENKESILALTNRFITAMHVDSDHLGLLQPNHEPRATDFIAPMQGMISRLIDQQLAYQGDDGDINFSVRSFPKYGQLSGKAIDDLNAGERVAIGSGKRDPLDFVLWKSAKPEEPSDTRWKSPWGKDDPAGILNVRQCLVIFSDNILIFMVAVLICNFPTMKMKLPKVKGLSTVKTVNHLIPPL